RRTGREQLAAGRTVQAGIADDGRILRAEAAALGRGDYQLAAGHALADVVVGIAFQEQVKATSVPHAKALACRALEAEGDRCILHALVAMQTRNFAGNTRTDGAAAVADINLEHANVFAFDGATR